MKNVQSLLQSGWLVLKKGRSLINTIEWNPFIAKLPPYDRYSFVTQPNWEVPVIEKPMIQYFKIKDEWFANLKKDEQKAKDYLEASGVLETTELYQDTGGYPVSTPGVESMDEVSNITVAKAIYKSTKS